MNVKLLILFVLMCSFFSFSIFSQNTVEAPKASNVRGKTNDEFSYIEDVAYFQECNGENFSKIVKGASKEEVRNLLNGKQYIPYMAYPSGDHFEFSISDDSDIPIEIDKIPQGIADIFMSKGGIVAESKILYVKYDNNNRVEISKVLSYRSIDATVN